VEGRALSPALRLASDPHRAARCALVRLEMVSKKKQGGGSCKWCAMGDCWTHTNGKGKGKGKAMGGKGMQARSPDAEGLSPMDCCLGFSERRRCALEKGRQMTLTHREAPAMLEERPSRDRGHRRGGIRGAPRPGSGTAPAQALGAPGGWAKGGKGPTRYIASCRTVDAVMLGYMVLRRTALYHTPTYRARTILHCTTLQYPTKR